MLLKRRSNFLLKLILIEHFLLISTQNFDYFDSKELYSDMSPEIIKTMLDDAEEKMVQHFHEIYQRGAEISKETPSWFMAISHAMKPNVKNISNIALIMEEATRYMADQYNLSRHQILFDLATMNISQTIIGKHCPLIKSKPCQPKKYRSYSGYCNNVLQPYWGMANTAYQRHLPPDYEDAISIPRGGGVTDPQLLPSPREISLGIHSSKYATRHKHLMVISVIWGEFISHDIFHTPQMSGMKIDRLKCCGVNENNFHPECFPIRIPKNDPVYGKNTDEQCQEYVRSAVAPRVDCTMGAREQINQATPYIDGSMIYGTSLEEAEHLRLFQNGLLRMDNEFSGSILSIFNDSNFCRSSENLGGCFRAGDIRANEHVGIAVMYTLWFREHNRIATILSNINPHWTDETLYQETRKIIIAALQHITYNEFLPLILGEEYMKKYDLLLENSDYSMKYDVNMNPVMSNTVATAVLPFLMSLLPNVLSVINQSGEKIGEQSLLASFYAPFPLFEHGGMDRILQGLIHDTAMNADSYIEDALINSLFKKRNYEGHGLDIAAQIIQRGRDHGIPSYTEWRKYCHQPEVKTFHDLANYIPKSTVKIFQKMYKGVSDIDLFPAALSEEPISGGIVGPTFACLLSQQFQQLKLGDRHWYENNLPPSSFKLDQLNEIRKYTLTKVICLNSNFIHRMQSKTFIGKDNYLNNMLHCSDHLSNEIDFSKWEEQEPELNIDRYLLNEAIKAAKEDIDKIYDMELKSFQSAADPRSPIGAAYSFNRPKSQSQAIANSSFFYQLASKHFISLQIQQDQETNNPKKKLNEIKKLIALLPNINTAEMAIIGSAGDSVCDDTEGPCDHTSKYRMITGRCNNLKYPQRGQALKPFLRLLSPAYDDGIGSPRQTSINGYPLPSPRLISSTLHTDRVNSHSRYSLMLMQFAQILDHDLTHTPVNRGHLGRGIIDCSPCDSAITVHPDCIPITIASNDTFFPNSENGREKCIPVTRSLPGRLTLGYREQMSQVTAYIDASFVYGSDRCEAEILRTFSSGFLNSTRKYNGKDLLPEIDTHPECRSKNGICFRAGDARASEQPSLTAFHTIFLREHNRIAEILAKINPHWSDEQLYQETRRILSAMVQHITFSEFLPRVLGWNFINKHNLNLENFQYFKGYDSECDATIVNEFAAAAYRFGHTLLKPSFIRVNQKYEKIDPSIRLRHHFFNPEIVNQDGIIDEILRGLVVSPMEKFDRFVTREVTNHLFEDSKPFSGMDLVAINIQRARDHGIPGYNQYRQLCNLTKATTFDDLINTIKPYLIENLKKVYRHVDDIDLFSGGLLETSLNGGIVGPTFACIIGDQFQRLRKCDRFWYENIDPFIRFTKFQLNEIRKMTLARLLCNNLDQVDQIQRHVLDLPDEFLNPMMSCNTIPKMDLIHWKDRQSCTFDNSIEMSIGTIKNVSPCTRCACTKEGMLCNSQRIHNCYKLNEKYNWTTIMNDSICKIQCGFLNRFVEYQLL